VSWLADNNKVELAAGSCGVTGLTIMSISDMGWLLLIAFWLYLAWRMSK